MSVMLAAVLLYHTSFIYRLAHKRKADIFKREITKVIRAIN